MNWALNMTVINIKLSEIAICYFFFYAFKKEKWRDSFVVYNSSLLGQWLKGTYLISGKKGIVSASYMRTRQYSNSAWTWYSDAIALAQRHKALKHPSHYSLLE